jgi:hypothetical protein
MRREIACPLVVSGHFDTSDHDKRLYEAGWPKDIRPYQARHSIALELGERGIDLAGVGDRPNPQSMACRSSSNVRLTLETSRPFPYGLEVLDGVCVLQVAHGGFPCGP